LLIDEADSLTFADSLAFQSFIGDLKCVCLTATPDDQDVRGMEKAVIDKLGFVRYAPVLDQAQAKPELIPHCRELSLEQGVLRFVKEEVRTRPVLLFCDEEMKMEFEKQGQAFVFVSAEISDATLANLDSERSADGTYLLLLATQ
jgi:hypothetical protein